jgi:hypothetical protein
VQEKSAGNKKCMTKSEETKIAGNKVHKIRGIPYVVRACKIFLSGMVFTVKFALTDEGTANKAPGLIYFAINQIKSNLIR